MSNENACNYILALNEDGTFKDQATDIDWSDVGKYTYDGNNWFFDYNNSRDLYATGNYEKFVIDTGGTMDGTPSYMRCTLIK